MYSHPYCPLIVTLKSFGEHPFKRTQTADAPRICYTIQRSNTAVVWLCDKIDEVGVLIWAMCVWKPVWRETRRGSRLCHNGAFVHRESVGKCEDRLDSLWGVEGRCISARPFCCPVEGNRGMPGARWYTQHTHTLTQLHRNNIDFSLQVNFKTIIIFKSIHVLNVSLNQSWHYRYIGKEKNRKISD